MTTESHLAMASVSFANRLTKLYLLRIPIHSALTKLVSEVGPPGEVQTVVTVPRVIVGPSC